MKIKLKFNKIFFLKDFEKSKLPANDLPGRIENFTGRESILERINKAFVENKNKIVVLSSYAGIGKSSIANEYACQFIAKQSDHFAYWMKSDGNNIDLEFEKFAKYCQINRNDVESKQEFTRRLKNKLFDLNEKILFIFDNCDNPQSISSYILMCSFLKNVFS